MEKIYVCGPTVWNYVHIGNLRPILTFDIFTRIKKELNKEFVFVHNITDIDDKIIKKALAENKSEKEISEFYFQKYLEILNLYNINKPTYLLKVTDHLDLIINYIQELINNNKAYIVDGNVFFDIQSIPNYGQVSGQKMNQMLNHENSSLKKNPQDFALWKKTNIGIQYDSPFGKGRPGWHTECVVLINKIFNQETIDIHSGAIDLIFPHHENENAQFVALNNKPLTHTWLHTGHIYWNGQKMSKSLGNIIDAFDFIDKYDVDILRNIILSSSITGHINLTEGLINSNLKVINRYRKIYNNYYLNELNQKVDERQKSEILNLFENQKFAQANKKIHELMKNPNNDFTLINIFKILGFKFANTNISTNDKKLYEKWLLLKEEKQFEEADSIRKVLLEKKLV